MIDGGFSSWGRDDERDDSCTELEVPDRDPYVEAKRIDMTACLDKFYGRRANWQQNVTCLQELARQLCQRHSTVHDGPVTHMNFVDCDLRGYDRLPANPISQVFRHHTHFYIYIIMMCIYIYTYV